MRFMLESVWIASRPSSGKRARFIDIQVADDPQKKLP